MQRKIEKWYNSIHKGNQHFQYKYICKNTRVTKGGMKNESMTDLVLINRINERGSRLGMNGNEIFQRRGDGRYSLSCCVWMF